MFLPGCDAILDSSIWGHARYVYVSNLCLLYLWLEHRLVLLGILQKFFSVVCLIDGLISNFGRFVARYFSNIRYKFC